MKPCQAKAVYRHSSPGQNRHFIATTSVGNRTNRHFIVNGDMGKKTQVAMHML
jgi:hypothetical protein